MSSTPKSTSAKSVFVSPWLNPATLCDVASFVVNSRKPSPFTSAPVETAPAFQPSAPLFVSVLPLAATPAALPNVTSVANVPASVTSVSVAPGVKSAVSTSNG